MTKQEGAKLKAYHLLCQHCQSLQKTIDWKGKSCRVIQYSELEAMCVAALDVVDILFNGTHSEDTILGVDSGMLCQIMDNPYLQ